MLPTKTPTSRRRSAQSGFTLIEVLLGSAILLIALLGHMSASWSAGQLSRTERSRSEGLRVAQEFMERMRTDDSWADLYTRMRSRMQASADPAGAVAAGNALLDFDLMQLNDGTNALPVEAYFADFTGSPPRERVSVLVDVPGTTGAGGLPILREDAVAPEYGLPADLNGDGVIDANNHADDYLALPMIIRIRYLLEGEQPYELRMVTWLKGYR